jgi:hypothetical protein
MDVDIATQTLTEHKKLIDLIDELTRALRKLPNDVQWGNSSWMQDMEILDFIRVQTLSLENAKENAIRGYYRDTYHLIRMIFEAYLILRLISTCDKYPLRIKVVRAKTDPDMNSARNRIIQRAQKTFGGSLITTYTEGKDIVVAVLRGIPIVDNTDKEPGVTIPYYYGAWHNFRPLEYHLRRDTLQDRIPTLRFLTGEWASIPRKTKQDLTKNYGLLYKYFLTFGRILENLRLNGVLNKKTSTRVLVHYNFLSEFSHCTSDSVSLITRRRLHQIASGGLDNVYDHYLSELALLYVCHLLSMHLEHAVYYLRWRSIRLKNEKEIYRPICQRVESVFGYIWFIFNRPHQYDRYSHANHKCDYKKKIFYRPEDIRMGDVRYYDNPLHRLKELHQSQRELTTGNFYISPFPRDDALP